VYNGEKSSDRKNLQFNVLCMFIIVFHKSKKMIFNVFYLQINVFNIYVKNRDEPIALNR